MKKILTLICAGAGGLVLAGCTTANSNHVTLAPVGPAPGQTAATQPADGLLVVYSAYDVNADFSVRDPYRPEYSDYKILTRNGKLLQHVHNSSGTIFQTPATVKLPPGAYRVVAEANGYGQVTVPVVIAAEQKTVLHLEGGSSFPGRSSYTQADAVRLPDGEVVGWPADKNTIPAP